MYVFHGTGVGAGVGAGVAVGVGVAVGKGVEVGATVGVALGEADGAIDGAALVTGAVDASAFATDDGAGVAVLPQALTSPAMSSAEIARCRTMTLLSSSLIDAEGDACLDDAAATASLRTVGGGDQAA